MPGLESHADGMLVYRNLVKGGNKIGLSTRVNGKYPGILRLFINTLSMWAYI